MHNNGVPFIAIKWMSVAITEIMKYIPHPEETIVKLESALKHFSPQGMHISDSAGESDNA